ncbi:MAG: hypothetical protein ACREYD_05525 [Casimicrobiaceae bacterium]
MMNRDQVKDTAKNVAGRVQQKFGELAESWIMQVRAGPEPEPAAPWDETVINGTPYEPGKRLRPRDGDRAVVESPDTKFAEELKRRQLESMRFR